VSNAILLPAQQPSAASPARSTPSRKRQAANFGIFAKKSDQARVIRALHPPKALKGMAFAPISKDRRRRFWAPPHLSAIGETLDMRSRQYRKITLKSAT
jgi:hypothetical protein